MKKRLLIFVKQLWSSGKWVLLEDSEKYNSRNSLRAKRAELERLALMVTIASINGSNCIGRKQNRGLHSQIHNSQFFFEPPDAQLAREMLIYI